MKTFSYSRGIRAALVGIATTGARYTVWLSTVGAASALLWVPSTTAPEQLLPGAMVESVVAIAKRVNPTVAAASLDFDAAVRKIGTAGVLADPTLVLEAGSADLSIVFESERRLRTVQLDLLKLKVELQKKYAEMERLAGGSL
jgi:hypothetical protein